MCHGITLPLPAMVLILLVGSYRHVVGVLMVLVLLNNSEFSGGRGHVWHELGTKIRCRVPNLGPQGTRQITVRSPEARPGKPTLLVASSCRVGNQPASLGCSLQAPLGHGLIAHPSLGAWKAVGCPNWSLQIRRPLKLALDFHFIEIGFQLPSAFV